MRSKTEKMIGPGMCKNGRGDDKEIARLSRRLARGGAFVFTGSVLSRALGFVLQVFLGRMLGVAGYGIYALGVSVIEVCGQLSQLGISNGLVRFVAMCRAESNIPGLKGTLLASFGMGLGASLAGAVALACAAPWLSIRVFHEPGLVLPLRILAFALPFYNLASFAQSALRGAQRMATFALIGVARVIATLVAAGALVIAGFGVAGAVGGFAIAALLTSILGISILVKSLPANTWYVGASPQLREILRFSIPLYLAGFSYIIMSRTDIMMLGYFSSSADVGAYRAAVSLARLAVFALAAINMAFAPMIAELYQRNEHEELSRIYKTAARWSMLLSLVVALPLILFSNELLGMYGSDFQRAEWALVILAVFQLVNAGVGSVGFMLQMSGHQDWVLGNNLFSAAMNVVLNLWWIPRWGILGAAVATGLSLAANNLFGMIEVYILLKTQPFDRDYMRLLFPTFGAIVVFNLSVWFNISWWQNLMLSVTGFIIVFFLAGLNTTDRMIMRSFLNRVVR